MGWLWICCCPQSTSSSSDSESETILIYSKNETKDLLEKEISSKNDSREAKAEFLIPGNFNADGVYRMKLSKVQPDSASIDCSLYPQTGNELRNIQQLRSHRSESFAGYGVRELSKSNRGKQNAIFSGVLDRAGKSGSKNESSEIEKCDRNTEKCVLTRSLSGEFVTGAHDTLSNMYRNWSNEFEFFNGMELPSSNLNKLSEQCAHYSKEDGIFGHLVFSLFYDPNMKELNISINKIVGLPCKGLLGNAYRSFVKIDTYLSSEHIDTRTNLSIPSLNPKFNETFTFSIDLSKQKWNDRYIRFSIYEMERTNIEDAIGHALLPFRVIEKSQPEWFFYSLCLKKEYIPESCGGELLIKLMYDSLREKLKVVVDIARNLRLTNNKTFVQKSKNKDSKESVNTYVKVTLRNSGEKIKSVRTTVAKGNLEAVYKQSFSFVLPLAYINESSIVFSLMQQSLLKSHDLLLGRTVEGPFLYSQNDETTLWGCMLRTRTLVSSWKNIYP